MNWKKILLIMFVLIGAIGTYTTESDIILADGGLTLGIITALLSLAAGGLGAAKSSQETRKNQNLIDQRNAENSREMYRGVLDDSASQAYLSRLDRGMRDTMAGVNNSAVSTGSTQENLLAQKESANEAVSNAMANLLSREDYKRTTLLDRQNGIDSLQMQNNQSRANNWASMAKNISDSATALGSAYIESDGKLFN